MPDSLAYARNFRPSCPSTPSRPSRPSRPISTLSTSAVAGLKSLGGQAGWHEWLAAVAEAPAVAATQYAGTTAAEGLIDGKRHKPGPSAILAVLSLQQPAARSHKRAPYGSARRGFHEVQG